MHVAHVITRLIIGGAQENTLLTCEGLHQRGRRVTLISGPTQGPEGSLRGRAQRGGYAFIEVPELIRAVRPWTDWRALRRLTTTFRELRPDVVHTHSSKAGILARLAAERARVPVIVHTVHGMSFNRTQPWPVRRFYAALERRAARCTHAIVGVADAMVRQMLAAGIGTPQRMHTVYSGMEVERFDPRRCDRASVRQEWGVGEDEVVVGSVARLFRNKGYEQLIRIMADAAARESRLCFVWVGDGAQRAEYEAALRKRGLAERTTLLGLQAPERIPAILAGCDLLAHTSQWEGLPRAVVQALLMETPAVAFAIDGTPEVVLDGRTGRLVPLGDERAFADALVELARDAPMRRQMGKVGRELCLQRFDWRRMVAQLDALYAQLRSAQ
ncbi:MAG: glycosyltransferase family 4 protein [Phycisphaerae bacterium]|jgi:glycosyltransferase involved in cell wall biosynthesis